MVDHGPDCPCARCRGFEPGNQVAVRHGAYASVGLAPRVAELVEELHEIVPVGSPADEPVIRTLAIVLARIERAEAAFARVDAATDEPLRDYLDGVMSDALERLRKDLRLWVNTARALMNDLGLTPTSRAKLKLNVALGEDAAQRLQRHVDKTYGDDSVKP